MLEKLWKLAIICRGACPPQGWGQISKVTAICPGLTPLRAWGEHRFTLTRRGWESREPGWSWVILVAGALGSAKAYGGGRLTLRQNQTTILIFLNFNEFSA